MFSNCVQRKPSDPARARRESADRITERRGSPRARRRRPPLVLGLTPPRGAGRGSPTAPVLSEPASRALGMLLVNRYGSRCRAGGQRGYHAHEVFASRFHAERARDSGRPPNWSPSLSLRSSIRGYPAGARGPHSPLSFSANFFGGTVSGTGSSQRSNDVAVMKDCSRANCQRSIYER